MGTITLDYGMMRKAESNAKKAASKCEAYGRKIQSKVTQKLDALERGMTSHTSSSAYFANQKIRRLNQKQDKYIAFANHLKLAREYASDKDKDVSSYIKSESKVFRKKHDMNVNAVAEWFTWMTTTLINKTAFGRLVSQWFKKAGAWLDGAARDFKRWYHLDGGKYMIKAVLKAVGTVVAVALLVWVAIPAMLTAVSALAGAFLAGTAITGMMIWTAITSVAAFATAVITVMDGVAKVHGNIHAYLNNENEPGWAKRYGSCSSFSDYLRKTMFSSGFLNKFSYQAANMYDLVNNVATAINFADMARQAHKFCLRIKEQGKGRIFDKVRFKRPGGKVTRKTFLSGLKNLNRNRKVYKTGMDATNISKIKNYHKALNADKLKPFLKLEKYLKVLDKGVSWYDGIYDKGIFGSSVNSITSEIRKKTVLWDRIHSLKDSYKDTKKMIQNINTRHTITPLHP